LTKIRIPSRSRSSSMASLKNEAHSKPHLLRWKMVWCLWSCCTLSNWTGSLYGWFLHRAVADAHHIQAIGHLLWKAIAFSMLSLCVSILFDIKSMIHHTLALFETLDLEAPPKELHRSDSNRTENGRADSVRDRADSNRTDTVGAELQQLSELRTALKRIRALIVFEVALSVVLSVAVVYESYVIYQIERGEYAVNIYAESTVMSMLCYFPLWSLVHSVLLVYGWIPSERERAEPTRNERDLIDYVTEETPEPPPLFPMETCSEPNGPPTATATATATVQTTETVPSQNAEIMQPAAVPLPAEIDCNGMVFFEETEQNGMVYLEEMSASPPPAPR